MEFLLRPPSNRRSYDVLVLENAVLNLNNMEVLKRFRAEQNNAFPNTRRNPETAHEMNKGLNKSHYAQRRSYDALL